MKENIKLGLILALITAIAGLLLGFAYENTKDVIAQNGKLSKEQISIIMPGADKVREIPVSIIEGSNVKEVYEAYRGGEHAGYLIKVTTKGFHGDIGLLVGITSDDKLSGVKVLSHSETPGVGSKIEKESFTDKFKDKSIKTALKLVKLPSSSDSEIAAVSGATVSSTAVNSGVNEAISFYKTNLKGGK